MSGNLSSLAIGGGAIKSIQRGVAGAGTVTITAVNTSKAVVANLGNSNDHSSLVLTDSTTLTVTTAGGGAVSWQVVEYY